MIRDFTNLDENGIPECFGECIELDPVCLECPRETRDRCIDEKIEDEKRDPDTLDYFGEPKCFGKHYSDYSKKCTKECDSAITCVENNRKDRVHLPVLNNKPPTNVSDPYKSKVNPFEYKTPSYSAPYSSPTVAAPPKPFMSNETIEQRYGVRPHPNPIVPGQFEGEEWYVRLGKEFVLQTTNHGIKVMAELLMTMFSRIRWAPSTENNDENRTNN